MKNKSESSIKLTFKETGIIYCPSTHITTSNDVAFIFSELRNTDREKFAVLSADEENKILGSEIVSIGTLNASLVHPREVFKTPLNLNAKKVIFAHNHPSGDPTFSEDDIKLTKRLKKVGDILGIKLLYHITLGDKEYMCMDENENFSRFPIPEQEPLKMTPISQLEVSVIKKTASKMLLNKTIKKPQDAYEIIKPIFDKDKPMAYTLYLNTRNEIISLQPICSDEDSLSNEHILKNAILSNAASFMLCSNFDISISKIKELEKQADLTGIEMLDYLQIDKENISYNSYKAGNFVGKVSEERVKYQYDLFEDFDRYKKEENAKTTVKHSKTVEQKTQHLTNKEIEELIKSKDRFTESEKEILMQYTGSGGLEKQGAVGRGLLDEYYTPVPVIEKIWQITDNYIDTTEPLNILEPSIGKGVFLSGRDFNKDTIITGYEVSPLSSKIAQTLLSDDEGCIVKIFNQPFESIFIDERGTQKQHKLTNSFDLVIGNPPYGTHRGRYKGLGEEPSIHEYDQYFLKRSVELVKENGLVIFVMPSGFLRNKNNYAKEEISKLGFLLDAHRLPNSTFSTTDIGTDIVIFKKNSTEDIEIIKKRQEAISDDSYFISRPEKIIGFEKERKGRFGLEKYVEGDIEDVLNYEPEKADEDKLAGFIDKNLKPDVLKVITPTRTTPESKPKKKTYTAFIINQKQDEIIPIKENDISEKELELWLHIAATGEIDSQWLEKINIKDYEGQVNYYNDKYFNNFNYCQGNIYEKLDDLERDNNALPDDIKKQQKEKLLAVLPKLAEIPDIKLSPIDVLTDEITFLDNQTLKDKFKNYLELLPDDVFLNSSEWEIEQYIYNKPVFGHDVVRNAEIRRRRRKVASTLFDKFVKEELAKEEQNILLKTYNRNRNATAKPDYSKVPLLSKVFATFKGDTSKLWDHQTIGVGFLVNKGLGCLAHEVGAGKTRTSIIATNELLFRGWIQKPLFVVPRNIYRKWIEEICEVIPGAKINDLSNLGGKYKGDITKLKIEPGTITIITTEGLNKLGFKQETYEQLTYKLQDVISGINSTKRQAASEEARANTLIGTAIKGTTEKIYFEDLGFDHIILDEAHRYKNIFTSAKIQKGEANEYSSVRGGRSSARGIKTYLATQYILNKYNNRGVFLLTATPFTNSPIEYYSMLGLLAKKRMEENGLKNVNVFMTAFMDMKTSFVIKADRTLKQEDIIERFKNAQQLRRLINEYFDFKTGEELGIIRPEKTRKPVFIKPTELQSNYMLRAEELFDDKDAGGPIVAITELQNITLSPFLSRYCKKPPESCKEFVETSPKIHFVMEAIKQVKKDKQETGQIIYMPRGVEYHTLIKEYLIKEVGYNPDEVEIISGIHNNSDNAIDDIRDRFNAGQIKVLIGSDTIKEGIDLQENTTDLYTLHLPWNPLDLEQMEGRLWRYGNKWANIRSTYPLIENSIDPFIFQKLETKLKRIQNVRTDNTNEIDVSELDFSELKLDLITDPARRLAAEKTLLLSEENNKLLVAKSEIAFLQNITEKVDTISEKINKEKENIKYWKNYRTSDEGYGKNQIKYHESKIERYEETLKKHKKKLKGIDTDDITRKITKLTEAIQGQEKKIESIEMQYEKKIEKTKKIKVELKIEPNDFTPEIRKIEEENKTFFVLMEGRMKKIKEEDVTSGNASFIKEDNVMYESENILDKKTALNSCEKVKTVETEKAIMQMIISSMISENTPTIQSIIGTKIKVNIKNEKELRKLNRQWKKTYASNKLFDTNGFLKPKSEIIPRRKIESPVILKKESVKMDKIIPELKEEEKRTILKFNEKGIPYMKTLDNIPGVQTIIKTLNELKKQGNERPLIVAGDLSGMGNFNNKYGREVADGAIEKALEIFVKEFAGTGASVGSPSGDEMWGVPKQEEKVEKIVEQLTDISKKLNNENYEANGDTVGLNAKFYIGRKSFADVEKYLKYNQKTGEKLPPGTIVVEGALLNSKEDVIINPKEVSNESIVRKTERTGVRGNIEKETGTDGTGYERRIAPQTDQEKSRQQKTEKTREMTAEEKEKLENIQKEINNLVKQRSGITGKKFIENKKPSPGSRRAGEAENQKPREKIYGQQEEKISINNEAMLQNAHGVEWMTKQLKEKMEQTEKRLNETKNLTAEQKKDIAEILNNETGKTIWTKQSLSPDCCIAAARMLSGKEKNKEDILKDFPEIQQRILKNIEKEKEFSTGFER